MKAKDLAEKIAHGVFDERKPLGQVLSELKTPEPTPSNLDLAEAREVERRMTASPWTHGTDHRADSVFVAAGGGNRQSEDDGELGPGGLVCSGMMRPVDERNACGISYMRNHWLALLSEVERLRGLYDRAEISEPIQDMGNGITLCRTLPIPMQVQERIESLTAERDAAKREQAIAEASLAKWPGLVDLQLEAMNRAYAERDIAIAALADANEQIAELRAAIATPEVYAGVITRVVEDERDAAVVARNTLEMHWLHEQAQKEHYRKERDEAREQLAAARADQERLDFIADYVRVEPFDMPTGQGDADVGWRFIRFHMDAPRERVVYEHHSDNLREAITAAIAGKEKGDGKS